MGKSKEELALEYPQIIADIDLCYAHIFATCSGEMEYLSVPPRKENYNIQLCAALDELIAFRNLANSFGGVTKISRLKEQIDADFQPSLIKSHAISIFDEWNDITGAIPKGSLWYCEAVSVIKEIAAMAFGSGYFTTLKNGKKPDE